MPRRVSRGPAGECGCAARVASSSVRWVVFVPAGGSLVAAFAACTYVRTPRREMHEAGIVVEQADTGVEAGMDTTAAGKGQRAESGTAAGGDRRHRDCGRASVSVEDTGSTRYVSFPDAWDPWAAHGRASLPKGDRCCLHSQRWLETNDQPVRQLGDGESSARSSRTAACGVSGYAKTEAIASSKAGLSKPC